MPVHTTISGTTPSPGSSASQAAITTGSSSKTSPSTAGSTSRAITTSSAATTAPSTMPSTSTSTPIAYAIGHMIDNVTFPPPPPNAAIASYASNVRNTAF